MGRAVNDYTPSLSYNRGILCPPGRELAGSKLLCPRSLLLATYYSLRVSRRSSSLPMGTVSSPCVQCLAGDPIFHIHTPYCMLKKFTVGLISSTEPTRRQPGQYRFKNRFRPQVRKYCGPCAPKLYKSAKNCPNRILFKTHTFRKPAAKQRVAGAVERRKGFRGIRGGACRYR
jgi:hypothetical protein